MTNHAYVDPKIYNAFGLGISPEETIKRLSKIIGELKTHIEFLEKTDIYQQKRINELENQLEYQREAEWNYTQSCF